DPWEVASQAAVIQIKKAKETGAQISSLLTIMARIILQRPSSPKSQEDKEENAPAAENNSYAKTD
ncbi:hypothetical protein P7K49_014222, partial [Saguinus oedipus]